MKPAIPKGTRDFLPDDVLKREYLFGVITRVFRKFGFAPIETPAMENLTTLTGKYGEEGDRLLFRVLNNGDFLSGADADALDRKDSQAVAGSIAKRGMRYDLTVPFARFVVMHQNDLQFPFKRYQIQPVWRADRPQKGRYQEFYQCDVDVVGSKSLLYEAELVQIYDEVFAALELPVIIRLNHRKILTGIAEVCGVPEQLTAMTVAIDKWDKIGKDGVHQEMTKRGIPDTAINNILSILAESTLEGLEVRLDDSETAMKGIRELKQVFNFLRDHPLRNRCIFDIRLARGLDYYTGCIYEVVAMDADMGSLGGGGRYDDLTAVFGMPGTPGVGISFGAERIFDVMESKQLFPSTLKSCPEILFVAMSDEALQQAFTYATELRKHQINTDIYPEAAKMQKQLRYANQIGVPIVAILGDDELTHQCILIKRMQSGEQSHVTIRELIAELRKGE